MNPCGQNDVVLLGVSFSVWFLFWLLFGGGGFLVSLVCFVPVFFVEKVFPVAQVREINKILFW